MSDFVGNIFTSNIFNICITKFYDQTMVVCLLFWSSPAAVAGFVIAALIGVAIYGRTLRSFAHVCEEASKVMPSFANLNTAPTPILKVVKIDIFAAGDHAKPTVVSTAARSISSVPVPKRIASSSSFSKKTAATFGVTGRQRILAHDFVIAAFALTQPKTSALLVGSSFTYDSQSAKHLTYHDVPIVAQVVWF